MIAEATAIHASHPDFLNRELRSKVLKGGMKTHSIQVGLSRWIVGAKRVLLYVRHHA